MTQIEKALAAAQSFLDVEGVVGVGQGELDGGACVVVFVDARTPRLDAAIPKQILGVPVDVRESGTFTAH